MNFVFAQRADSREDEWADSVCYGRILRGGYEIDTVQQFSQQTRSPFGATKLE